MKYEKSVFTEILEKLAEHSAALDKGEASHNDFIDFQNLEARIIRAYNDNRFDPVSYRSLRGIAESLHRDYRLSLGLDR